MSKDNGVLKAGSRVQHHDRVANKVSVGVIKQVIPATQEKRYFQKLGEAPITDQDRREMENWFLIEWDGGVVEEVAQWICTPEDNELERQYRSAYLEANASIQEKLAQAAKLLDEAEKISEETGVAFDSCLSPLPQSYRPASQSEKWNGLNQEFISSITGAYNEGSGWEHSQVGC
jgi:hypothetical protein